MAKGLKVFSVPTLPVFVPLLIEHSAPIATVPSTLTCLFGGQVKGAHHATHGGGIGPAASAEGCISCLCERSSFRFLYLLLGLLFDLILFTVPPGIFEGEKHGFFRSMCPRSINRLEVLLFLSRRLRFQRESEGAHASKGWSLITVSVLGTKHRTADRLGPLVQWFRKRLIAESSNGRTEGDPSYLP